jgi:outer membrane protein insertion porin family
MSRILKLTLLTLSFTIFTQLVFSQDTTEKVSVNPALSEIMNSRNPKRYTIAGINVVGTKSFDRNLVISITGLAIGDEISIPGSDAFSNALKKLWKQNLIADAQINIIELSTDNRIFIEIQIEERPRLLAFTFEGVKKGDKDDLDEKCALLKDRVLTEDMKLSAVEAIKKFYSDKGFKRVDVRMQETRPDVTQNAVELVFYIDKGKKVKVNSVNFVGNESIVDAKLKKQMKGTKEMTKVSLFPDAKPNPYGDTTVKQKTFGQFLKDADPLVPTRTLAYLDPYIRLRPFSSSKYTEKKLIEDKEKILDYYNQEGFRDVEIEKDTLMYNAKGNADVFLKVKEGKRYYFGNITWKGNTKYSDSLLTVFLGIKKGDIYNADRLYKKIGKVLTAEGGDIGSLYQDDGYLFFQIDAIETSVYNDTIDHEIRMREGAQATYGKITVSGNDKTKDYVILRELRTISGDKYSRQDVIRSQRELSQLGFLNQEKINPQMTPNASDGTVDINWQVEERSADQVELSAGFGGGIGLTGTLGFSFNNFSMKNIFKKSSWEPLPTGDGQKLSIRAQSNGRQFRSYNFSFTEPWLGGKKRNSFSISYFNTKFSNAFDQFGQPCKSCGKTSYLKNAGFGIALGKQLKWPDDFFNLIYGLNVQQYRLNNYGEIFPGFSNGTSTNVNLKVTLVRNSISNPLFPTSGSNFLLSGQFTLPYSRLGLSDETKQFKLPEFHKWRFNAEWYVPIGQARGAEKNKQFILKAAAKYGFIGRYNNRLAVSPFERFQVGDAGLSNQQGLLGFDVIAHRGYPIYASSNPKVNPDGVNQQQYFTIFNKYTVELRYPFSTSASSTIYGLAFFEAANGWYDFKEYNPFRLRRSAGLGMRFFLPMFGLLGFDYGVGFDRFTPNTNLKGAAKFTFMLGQEPE